ncbi:MAG: hypothetical protein AB7L90_04940 [Hyphomicrobiaceae bacterium]
MITRALGRLIMVPLGLILGAAVAASLLVTLGLEVTTHTLAARPDEFSKLEVLLDMGFGVITLAAASSVLPSLLWALMGEIARIRSALYYTVGGGISVALLPFVVGLGTNDTPIAAVPPRVWTVLATAGFAGGFVYWLIAGRRA